MAETQTDHTRNPRPPIVSARPEMTAALMVQTGLDDTILTDVVHTFYAKVRADAMLGPIFDARIQDWGPHLDRMVEFWSSIALMTGRYHGTPLHKHIGLPISGAHFDRWLALFSQTAQDMCTPAGADHLMQRADRIARTMTMAIYNAQRANPDIIST